MKITTDETILIVDAGSTKTEWSAVSRGGVLASYRSEGINAIVTPTVRIEEIVALAAGELGNHIPSRIFYYGAGCATTESCGRIGSILAALWPDAEIEVASDLLGAARALLGNKPGIACILGTGSNSCLYDGKDIIKNIPSLGFIIGDEGSGAALGKRLISDIYKGYLPESVKEDFLKESELSLSEILDRVYRQPSPNAFLASLVPYIKKNLWNPHICGMVIKEFSHFFRRNVAMYPGCRRLPVCFTGSIALHFSDVLKEAADTQGFSISSIVGDPSPSLIEFHAF